jgi:hypothetical protein
VGKPKTRVPELPSQRVPYPLVEEQYPGPLAAILDQIARKKGLAAQMDPSQFEWFIAWDRADDPPGHLTDPKLFTSYLVSNSKVYLRVHTGGSGGRLVLYEELHNPPESVIANFERYARGVCEKRKQKPTILLKYDKEPPAGLVLGPKSEVAVNGPLVSLDQWVRDNPNHDHRLARVVRLAVQELLASKEE